MDISSPATPFAKVSQQCPGSVAAAEKEHLRCCAGQLPSTWSSMLDMQYFEAHDNSLSGENGQPHQLIPFLKAYHTLRAIHVEPEWYSPSVHC